MIKEYLNHEIFRQCNDDFSSSYMYTLEGIFGGNSLSIFCVFFSSGQS